MDKVPHNWDLRNPIYRRSHWPYGTGFCAYTNCVLWLDDVGLLMLAFARLGMPGMPCIQHIPLPLLSTFILTLLDLCAQQFVCFIYINSLHWPSCSGKPIEYLCSCTSRQGTHVVSYMDVRMHFSRSRCPCRILWATDIDHFSQQGMNRQPQITSPVYHSSLYMFVPRVGNV